MACPLVSLNDHTVLPESYIRPEADRPRLDEVIYDAPIPIIDLSDPDRSNIVKQIGYACAEYGVFQVVNHGVEEESMKAMLKVTGDLFKLPPEEKMKLYSDDMTKKIRLSTSFNVTKEKVHLWRDYLRLHCYPLEEYVHEWPSNPPAFRDVVSKYCTDTRNLGFTIFELISESLGLEKDHIAKALGGSGQDQHMAINYYPPCPQPELAYGHQPHTDPNVCTILFQDQVGGLQILHDGKWLQVQPHPGALVVNLGDMLQAMSNARYKSVWHRVIVNAQKERVSVASLLCPFYTSVISAPEELVEDGSPVYRTFLYDEYFKKFWSRNLNQKYCLDLFKVGANEDEE